MLGFDLVEYIKFLTQKHTKPLTYKKPDSSKEANTYSTPNKAAQRTQEVTRLKSPTHCETLEG